ncbi:MAG: PspC domain-containing protein [Candidatus Izemoplasmataceae bacterium]
MKEQKQLYRLEEGKMFSGVCAGLARYFNMDAGLVRVIFVLAFVFSGFLPILVVYIVMAAILPIGKDTLYRNESQKGNDFVKEDDYTINEDDYKY